MRIERLTPSREEEYEAFVEQCAGALGQHSLGWRDMLLSLPGDEEACYLVAWEDGQIVGVMPGTVLHTALGKHYQSLPYGYGGIASPLQGSKREELFRLFREKLYNLCAQDGIPLVTIFTPVLTADNSRYPKLFEPDFVFGTFYQYVDLDRDFQLTPRPWTSKYDRYRGKLRRNHRRNILSAEQAGVRIAIDQSRSALEQWYRLHQKRMGDFGAVPYPWEFFEGILRFLVSRNKAWYAYAYWEDHMISGSPFVGNQKVIDIIYVCADSEYMDKKPNFLLCYKMMEWAQLYGFRYWNWESVYSRQSSVYHWKEGWGSVEANNFYLVKILGDISGILESSLEQVKQVFGRRFVLPYIVWEKGLDKAPGYICKQ